jgi:hypothetical protein
LCEPMLKPTPEAVFRVMSGSVSTPAPDDGLLTRLAKFLNRTFDALLVDLGGGPRPWK